MQKMQKKLFLGLSAVLFCATSFAEPSVCPSPFDIKNAVYMSTPVFNVNVFSIVNGGFVVVNAPTPDAAKLFLQQTIASYSLVSNVYSVVPGISINYCDYAPGMNVQPSQTTMGIYWIQTQLSSSQLVNQVMKK